MKTIKKIGLVSAVAFAIFALSACDDSSSAGGDNGSGGNRGGIPDTVETFMELSDYDCGKSQKCVATCLTEYHNMAVCDGDNGWVIGTLIEKMDCDFSSSSDKSSDSKSNDPAEVTDKSSDSKDCPLLRQEHRPNQVTRIRLEMTQCQATVLRSPPPAV